jgi:hypothetical protein
VKPVIYGLEHKEALVPLGELAEQKAELASGQTHASFIASLKRWLGWLIWIPLVPFTVAYTLVKGLLLVGDVVERAEATSRRRQADYGYNIDRVVIEDDYDERTGCLTLGMNDHALKGFAGALRDLFSEREPAPQMGVFGFRGVKKVRPTDSGWHVHGDFLFSPLPEELTVSLSDDLLEIAEGYHLAASPEHWLKIADAWLEVACGREPKLIVLDRFQSEWCDSKSTGRFVIEYLPGLRAQGSAAD